MLLRRQTPKVGAGCSNWARPDPCGGVSSDGHPYRDPGPFPDVRLLRRGDFPVLLFFQMPVILARGIIDISLYNISDYATKNMHSVTICRIDLIKRSVLTRKKAYDKLFNAPLVNVSVSL